MSTRNETCIGRMVDRGIEFTFFAVRSAGGSYYIVQKFLRRGVEKSSYVNGGYASVEDAKAALQTFMSDKGETIIDSKGNVV